MSVNKDLSKEEAIRAIRAGFGKVLANVAFQCSAPIYWFTITRGSRGTVMNSGTIFFVDAGHGPIGITARHVIEGYREAHANNPDTACEVGGLLIDPLTDLIAEDPLRDIATLQVNFEQLKKIGKTVHVNPREWPPKPPEVSEGVFFGGYLGSLRSERPGVIQWGFGGGLDIVANVHDDRISICFNREDWVPQEDVQPPMQGAPWGGVSGGPVFAVVENHIVSWRLAGVAKEFNSNFELLYASSLSRIRPDGSIGEPV
jgi:hypothetical protein